MVRDNLVEAEWERWRSLTKRERKKEQSQGKREKDEQGFGKRRIDGEDELALKEKRT